MRYLISRLYTYSTPCLHHQNTPWSPRHGSEHYLQIDTSAPRISLSISRFILLLSRHWTRTSTGLAVDMVVQPPVLQSTRVFGTQVTGVLASKIDRFNELLPALSQLIAPRLYRCGSHINCRNLFVSIQSPRLNFVWSSTVVSILTQSLYIHRFTGPISSAAAELACHVIYQQGATRTHLFISTHGANLDVLEFIYSMPIS